MHQNPGFLYHPFYCEENIWQLCQDVRFKDLSAYAVFVSNADKSVAIWHQKLAKAPWLPVVFDYHVFLLARLPIARWEVWDLDTTLGLPVPAAVYLKRAFRPTGDFPKAYQPLFRLVAVNEFFETFSSDRSHMRDKSGNWLKKPPVWDAPYRPDLGMTLPDFVQMAWPDNPDQKTRESNVERGEVLTLPELLQRVASPV